MALLKTFVLVIFGINLTWSQDRNNVCKTVEDYFDNINENANCWFDNDLNATPEQRAKNHGLQLERHIVKTEDRYILTTFRLKSLSGLYGNEVIFLQHGLGTDSQCFMANGNKSMAFFLFGQGFDVWMGNYRGSQFSQHEYLSKNNTKFWDFCIHEHGIYDLSANFKYVTDKTKKKITYIGHSMGGTGLSIYASMKPDESVKYLKHAILIAPAIYLRTTKGLASPNYVMSLYQLMNFIDSMVPVNVLFGTNSFERQAFRRFCFSSLEGSHLCLDVFDELFGKTENEISPEKLPLAVQSFRNLPLNDFFHYFHMIQRRDFIMFDYGREENIVRYNSSMPPAYNVSKIIIPLTWLCLSSDNLATKSDLMYAFNRFRKPNWDIYELPYSHASILFNKNVDKITYPLLLKFINKYIK